MEDIGQRLQESVAQCLRSYEAWSKSKRESGNREALQEAVHELRKVAARLEIEIAASERDETAQRPLPIPPHRSSKRRPGGEDMTEFGSDTDDNAGNTASSEGNDHQPQQHQRQERSHSGGNRPHGGGPRRPRPDRNS